MCQLGIHLVSNTVNIFSLKKERKENKELIGNGLVDRKKLDELAQTLFLCRGLELNKRDCNQ